MQPLAGLLLVVAVLVAEEQVEVRFIRTVYYYYVYLEFNEVFFGLGLESILLGLIRLQL